MRSKQTVTGGYRGVSVRMPTEIDAFLVRQARREHVSKADVIRRVLLDVVRQGQAAGLGSRQSVKSAQA